MPGWLDEGPKPLELLSLRYLRIESDDGLVSRILSWLILPQTTFIHITRFSDFPDGMKLRLRSIVGIVDRVCLQQVALADDWEWTDYHMQCFSGDRECLRIDDFTVLKTALPVFRESAPVTHLTLSVVSLKPVTSDIDLHAFPHLVHLDVSGSDMDTMAFMLHPDLHPHNRRPGQVAEPSPPCLRLADLVITCRCLVPSPYRGRPKTLDPDELFHQECAFFQQALADRASRGTRLSYLALSLRLATTRSNEVSGRACGTAVGDIGAKQADRNEEAGRSGHPENDPDSGSNETPHKGAAKSDAMCPSHTARRSVLQSLQELVDGPVVLKLLDSAGGEMSIDEA